MTVQDGEPMVAGLNKHSSALTALSRRCLTAHLLAGVAAATNDGGHRSGWESTARGLLSRS